MEPSKTPGAESVAPVSKAPSESLGNATEVDQSKSKDEDESKYGQQVPPQTLGPKP